MSAPLSRYRERITPLGKPNLGMPGTTPMGVYKSYVNGSPVDTYNKYLTGAQPSKYFERTWDQNNREASSKRGRGSRVFRTGGPFVSIKVRVPAMEWRGGGTYSRVYNGFPNSYRWEYSGYFSNPEINHDGVDPSVYPTGGGSVLVGNTLLPPTAAWESQAYDIGPKLEKGSAFNILYEYKDVPGQLRQTAKLFKDIYKEMGGNPTTPLMSPHRVSEDYLNLQFGWLPFISDINRMADMLIFSKQYIDDITSGNNTWIKRKKILSNVESSNRIYRGYTPGCEPWGSDIELLCDDMLVDGVTCKGTFDVYSEDKTLVWAEGAFKYYRPEFDRSLPYYGSTVAAANRFITMTGARISPSHIWKAIPWSWAVDWFSNVGRIIERGEAQALDSMVTKYLYLMHHKIRLIRSLHRINFSSGALQLEWVRNIETKQRKSADSPYGFVLGGDLSATQWSILGALGLSRNVRFARTF